MCQKCFDKPTMDWSTVLYGARLLDNKGQVTTAVGVSDTVADSGRTGPTTTIWGPFASLQNTV